MSKALVVPALKAALLILCSYAISNSADDAPKHPFPMSQGTYWIYRGFVRYTYDTNHVSKANVTWRMEVRRFIQHGDVSAAVVSGFPRDLDWSDGSVQPSDSLFVESKGNFYRVPDARFEESLHRLGQTSDDLAGMLHGDDIFLKWPLQQGEKFCDSSGMARPDTHYCWFVKSSLLIDPQSIAGVSPGRRSTFVLIYRTNPDHIQFTFTQGVGITAYEYHHHGTVADTELKLVEFHQPSQGEK